MAYMCHIFTNSFVGGHLGSVTFKASDKSCYRPMGLSRTRTHVTEKEQVAGMCKQQWAQDLGGRSQVRSTPPPAIPQRTRWPWRGGRRWLAARLFRGSVRPRQQLGRKGKRAAAAPGASWARQGLQARMESEPGHHCHGDSCQSPGSCSGCEAPGAASVIWAQREACRPTGSEAIT